MVNVMECKIVDEFYHTRYDESGNKIEDIGFLKFADGTVKSFGNGIK